MESISSDRPSYISDSDSDSGGESPPPPPPPGSPPLRPLQEAAGEMMLLPRPKGHQTPPPGSNLQPVLSAGMIILHIELGDFFNASISSKKN